MKIKITPPFVGATMSGLYNKPTAENPSGELAIGAVIEMETVPPEWAGRYEVVESGEKVAITNPAKTDLVAPFTAVDKGKGWWAVIDANGTEIKSLRKDDAEIFNALSDDDKTAQVEAYAA